MLIGAQMWVTQQRSLAQAGVRKAAGVSEDPPKKQPHPQLEEPDSQSALITGPKHPALEGRYLPDNPDLGRLLNVWI